MGLQLAPKNVKVKYFGEMYYQPWEQSTVRKNKYIIELDPGFYYVDNSGGIAGTRFIDQATSFELSPNDIVSKLNRYFDKIKIIEM